MFVCPAVQVAESTERAQAVEAALAAEGATTINLDGREIRVTRDMVSYTMTEKVGGYRALMIASHRGCIVV
jgi:hypothetical protein